MARELEPKTTEIGVEDSTWSKDDIRRLNIFEDHRNLVIRATRRLLQDFYDRNFQGDEIVLEVGSGTGFLRRNWPEFSGGWIQLDSQPFFLEDAKKRNPEGSYVTGSAYRIPFPDESLDVVCGYASFDVLMDLEAALKEAYRALKPGGLFFHMIDCLPSNEPILGDLGKTPALIRQEGFEGEEGYLEMSIRVVSPERVEDYRRESEHVWDEEDKQSEEPPADDVSDIFTGLDRLGEKMDADSRLFRKYGYVVDNDDYFNRKLTYVLQQIFRPETVESRIVRKSYRGERTDWQMSQNGKAFVFYHNRAGRQALVCELLYRGPRMIGAIVRPLGRYFGRNCVEWSGIRVVQARK